MTDAEREQQREEARQEAIAASAMLGRMLLAIPFLGGLALAVWQVTLEHPSPVAVIVAMAFMLPFIASFRRPL